MNKKLIFSILTTAVILSPVVALAQGSGGGSGGYTLTGWIGNLKTNLVTIGGFIVVIGWVIAGILYLTAGGEPNRMSTAKKALAAAVIGTILIGISEVAADVISNIFA